MFCVSFDTDNALLCALCYFISYGALPLFVLPRATCSSSGNLAYVQCVWFLKTIGIIIIILSNNLAPLIIGHL